jgi:hypothetical protein
MFRSRDSNRGELLGREGRAARVMRRAGTVVSAVVALLFAVSLFCMMTWYDGTVWHVGYGHGVVGGVRVDYEEEARQSPGVQVVRWQRGLTVDRSWSVPVIWWPEAGCDGSPTFARRVVVPLWLPFALAAVPTSLLWRAELRRRRRIRQGLCAGCGYDRRGLPADAKCPECGTVPARG